MDKMQELIDGFLEKNDHQPLVFEDYVPEPDEFSLEKNSLKDLVIKCLKKCKSHWSVLEDGTFQCKNDCSRSSLDLWRHILHFHPDISYREVLGVLSESDDVLHTCSCPEIRRRVFCISSYLGAGVCSQHTKPDEFGLQFVDWKGFKV